MDNDKAGTEYWDNFWNNASRPKLFDPNDKKLGNYYYYQLHQYFKKILADRPISNMVEIGCANSVWPIYFHQQFDAQPNGIDYSEFGCDISRKLFDDHNINGNVYCADLFSPPENITQQFDFVASFGVVEHFENTAKCLKACSQFVKPGGLLFTMIPNMTYLTGFLQKIVNREVYDTHVTLSRKALTKAHSDAGLKLLGCHYFMGINLSVINVGDHIHHLRGRNLLRLFSYSNQVIWSIERMGLKLPPTRVFSPYIIALAEVQ